MQLEAGISLVCLSQYAILFCTLSVAWDFLMLPSAMTAVLLEYI